METLGNVQAALLPGSKPDRLVRRQEVMLMIGVKGTALHRLMEQEKFPRPRAITGKAVGWLESEVQAWIKSRPLASGARYVHGAMARKAKAAEARA